MTIWSRGGGQILKLLVLIWKCSNAFNPVLHEDDVVGEMSVNNLDDSPCKISLWNSYKIVFGSFFADGANKRHLIQNYSCQVYI